MAGGDVFGETFDIGTMSFTDDAFQNMNSTARNLAVTSAVGAVGGAALSVVGGAAVATGGAVAGAGLLAYGAVNRTRAAMNEASRWEGALRRDTANQARAANTENSMSDRYIDDLNTLQAKSRELEALRPQIQGADGEIRSLELEAANKRNAVQAALEKIDGLAGKIRDADATLKSQIAPAGGGRNDPGTDVLMNELQELKRKACEAAASLTGISDPAEKTRKLEEAKNYARDAAKKAEEISKLMGASQPQGDSPATQETLKTMENDLLEMEEIYSAIEADTRGILERVGLIWKRWGPLEKAWALQSEILLNLNLRKNFSDPLGEFAALRQIVSNPLPPKEGLKEAVESTVASQDQALRFESEAKGVVTTARELINEAKKKVPSATSPGVSPAQDPALLAQQAQACVTEGERQASGTGSERGTDEATTRSTGEGGGFQSAGEGTTGSSGEETVSPDGFGPAGMGRTEGGSGLSLLGAGMSGMSPAVPTPGTGESSTGGFGSAGAGQTTPGTGAGAQPAGAPPGGSKADSGSLIVGPQPFRGDGQPAAVHIFGATSRMGWAGGLAQYSVGPADQSIVEHLMTAGEHVMWANKMSFPPTPAWPGWSEKRSWLQSQANELARNRTNDYRRRIAGSMSGNYGSWCSELSVQTFGTTQKAANCDAYYCRLGFLMARGQQALLIADEANNNRDKQTTDKARADGLSHLSQAVQVLSDYEKVLAVSGRCADLRDVKQMLMNIIRGGNIPDQARAATAAWQTALERISALGQGGPPQPGKYEDCLKKYCPECLQTIDLLGVAKDQKCNDCKRKNEKLINECVAGTPSPVGRPVPPQPADPGQ